MKKERIRVLRRWGKLLIACLLTVSLAIMPVMGTNAQKGSTTKTSVQKQHRSTQAQMKQRAMTRLKQMKAHGILRLPSVAALGQQGMKSGKQGTAQSTEPSVVEFKGQATMYDIHYFYFSLSRQSDIEVIDVEGQEVPYSGQCGYPAVCDGYTRHARGQLLSDHFRIGGCFSTVPFQIERGRVDPGKFVPGASSFYHPVSFW